MQSTPLFCTVYSSAIVVVKRKKVKQFTFIVFALKVSFSSEFLFTQSGEVRESYKSFQMFNGKSCCYNFLITNVKAIDSRSITAIFRDSNEEMISYKSCMHCIYVHMYIICIPYTAFGNCCKSENRVNWLGTFFVLSPFCQGVR